MAVIPEVHLFLASAQPPAGGVRRWRVVAVDRVQGVSGGDAARCAW